MKNAKQQTTKTSSPVNANTKEKTATKAKSTAKRTVKNHGRARAVAFTDSQVRQIRACRKEKKMSYSEIASKFGFVSIGACWNVVNGKAYADVK